MLLQAEVLLVKAVLELLQGGSIAITNRLSGTDGERGSLRFGFMETRLRQRKVGSGYRAGTPLLR